MTFATANFVQRRQVIEDVLADVLSPYFEITHNCEGERCVASPGMGEGELDLLPLWIIASEMEAKLV